MGLEETDLEQYIIIHYHHLLSDNEQAAYKHHITSEKALNASESFGKVILNKWGTEDEDVLDLLKDGYDKFKKCVSERILREVPNEVFINDCPECGKLARTPKARKCRFCGHDWQ